MGSGCQDSHTHTHTHTHTQGESSRARRARKTRMGPRNTAPLIPARAPADDRKERQKVPKGDIKLQELARVQGTGSARFARLGTPSNPSWPAQKCICAGSPCEIARPKYRYHRRQQEPTCANPPTCSSSRKEGQGRAVIERRESEELATFGHLGPPRPLLLISTTHECVRPMIPSGLDHYLPCPTRCLAYSWVAAGLLPS